MSDTAIATEESLPPIETPQVGGDEPLSAREAARALSQYRWKRDAQPEAPQEAAEATEIPAQPESAAPETDTGAKTQQVEPQEEAPAPLELPRSWSKEQAERWAGLPRETQEYLL